LKWRRLAEFFHDSVANVQHYPHKDIEEALAIIKVEGDIAAEQAKS
jgi:hypothetical protein